MPTRLKPGGRDYPPPITRRAEADPPITMLPLRQREQATGGEPEMPVNRLGPAQGLLIGLALGAALWIGIFALAWHVLR